MARPQVTRLLDRPGGRALLGLAATAVLTIRERRPCRVRYTGAWIHRHGDRTVVESKIVLTSPEALDARVDEMFLTEYTPAPGDVVVDVGASVGRETAYLSRLVGPTGRVIAVEAHPRTFAMLESMVALNGLTNVTTTLRAIGADDSPVFLTDDETDHTRNRVSSSRTGVRVDGTTLIGLMEEVGIDRIDFLKMNIEGAEGPAIVAMGDRLGVVAHACISCHDFVADLYGDETYRTKETVRAAFANAGFVTTSRDDPRPHIRDVVYAAAGVHADRPATPRRP